MMMMLRRATLLTKAAPAMTGVRAMSALHAPQETNGNATSKKGRPAKIKTFKIWRYDPEQKNQKPYSVD